MKHLTHILASAGAYSQAAGRESLSRLPAAELR